MSPSSGVEVTMQGSRFFVGPEEQGLRAGRQSDGGNNIDVNRPESLRSCFS
jgi:hypothetical protein